ncbi:aminopeptidase [Megalodesulfovibrio paquesii]
MERMHTSSLLPSPLTPDELDSYASALLWGLSLARKKPLKKSDLIQIRYDLPALPLAEILAERLHRDGLIPVPQARDTAKMEYDTYTLANNKRLTTLIPGERELSEATAGSITLIAPESLMHLSKVDPANIAMAVSARKPLQSILSVREAAGDYGWTLGYYPTPALAEQAGMPLEEYAAEIARACLIARHEPVKEWRLFEKHIREIQHWLNSLPLAALRIQSASMDMLIPVGESRQWIALTGRNIPSFECYFSPDWRGVEGEFAATLPTFRNGVRVDGLRLEFRYGQVAAVHADSGLDFALEQLKMDAGASRVGEFALVDKRFSPISRFMANTLYDENFGGEHGSCHIALGQSYANSYAGLPEAFTQPVRERLGFNASALHWDLVNTEPKTVTATLKGGGKMKVYENGMFAM